jgi:hypothetical protein
MGYARRFYAGDLVRGRLLFTGLLAFVLTLAFSFWERREDAAPRAAREMPVERRALAAPPASNPVASRAWPAPAEAAAARSRAADAPAAVPASLPMPSATVSTADAEDDASSARRDRDAERGSRSR